VAALGILINTDRHLKHVQGLTRAALAKGHEVIIFVMDEGSRLLQDTGLVGLGSLPGVTLSLCDHSAKRHGVTTEGLPATVICGSQLNNAMMNHQAARVVVL
jgi:sulfur relay (sulfurtransferase) complex TusBCD TusD component (DsrE family)